METLPILSLLYRARIDEICKRLPSMGLKHVAMYLVFNDQTTFVLSNVYPILTTYYHEGLYREDFTYTPSLLKPFPNQAYFCDEVKSLSTYLKERLATQYCLFPTYNIIRQHAECTFVFSAIRDKPTASCQDFYDKTIDKFESFCSQFVTELIDVIIESNPHYRHAFILNNKTLRDAVIQRGYIEQPTIAPREQECLWHAAQGKSAKQIAQIMRLSPATVETYLKRIRETLQCSSLIEAILEAMHRGIIGKLSPFCTFPDLSTYKNHFARPFAAY